ncbi:MAG: hypothetical protein BroJett042_13300 [Bacteroidota bacterium]|nr:MAG: hypothetical protein BroJett042_13300 [Bacteroidota bacterium]
MKPAKTLLVGLIHASMLYISGELIAQNSVGIGVINPSPNAVLHLASPGNNQGLIIPQLTTTQRTAAAFQNNLTTNDSGLIVFDTTANAFYFWNGSAWEAVSLPQDLQLTGSVLTITNNPNATPIDLTPFTGTNTDEQTLIFAGTNLSITNGNTVNLASLNTDSQSLGNTAAGVNRTITITGGASTTFSVADNDNSVTNEIQTLSLSGANLTLSNGGGTVTLPTGTTYTAGTGISIAGNVITNSGDLSATNEIQTISKAGNTVTLSNGGGSFTDAVDDADASITNEIQDLQLIGNVLSITNNGSATPINLAPYVNTDNQNLSNVAAGTDRTINITGGTGTTFSVADNDNSATNELLQAASLIGSTLRLTDAGGNRDVVLTPIASKWTAAGANIYFANSVGIGTTTPARRLHVVQNGGALRLEGTDHTFLEFYPDGPATRKGFIGYTNASDDNLTIANQNPGAHIILSPTTGNVGVGTTAPSATFDVVGTSELNGTTTIHGAFATPSIAAISITGTAQILPKPTRRVVRITAASAGRAIRGIAAGDDGQEVILLNTGVQLIQITQSFTNVSNNTYDIIMPVTFNLTSYGTIHLIYDGSLSRWIEISRSANISQFN